MDDVKKLAVEVLGNIADSGDFSITVGCEGLGAMEFKCQSEGFGELYQTAIECALYAQMKPMYEHIIN